MAAFILSACSQSQNTNVEKPKDENIYTITSTTSYNIDLTNSKELAESADHIALVQIDKIEGTDNYSPVYEAYVHPYTYGKMTVLEVLSADIEPGSDVSFYRLGDSISYDRYLEGLSQPTKREIHVFI